MHGKIFRPRVWNYSVLMRVQMEAAISTVARDDQEKPDLHDIS